MVLSLNERRERAVLPLELALKAAVSNSDKDDCMMAVIADKNGFNINTFRSSINPTTPTHKANIYHFEAILSETKDARIMDSICLFMEMQLGLSCLKLMFYQILILFLKLEDWHMKMEI
jgi:hypothetical protein